MRQEGRSWSHPVLSLHARRSDQAALRLGVTVGKRVGGAVVRNRVRRRVRELMRARLSDLQPGWDLVVVARPSSAEATFADLSLALDQLIGRAHLQPEAP